MLLSLLLSITPLIVPLNLEEGLNYNKTAAKSIEFRMPMVPAEKTVLASAMNSIPHPPLDNPVDLTLKKLKDYKEVITHEDPDYIMVFTRIPFSRKSAKDYASEIATITKEYSQYGYTPIIIIEPLERLNRVNLGKIKSGMFDEYIDMFFEELSLTHGITTKQLGLIVPYPEINTPAFDRTNFSPEDFGPLVNSYFYIAQKHYPGLRGSILLDSKSYTTDNWGEGKYSSLKPYLSGIDPKYIQSFGLQGFPWMSEDGKTKFFNMRTILPLHLIQEATTILSTKNIWFNTGTFGRVYNSETRINPSERWKILNSLVMHVRLLKLRGYTSVVHIFSQNNLQIEGENTDWSYTQSKEDLMILSEFMKRTHAASIKVGFYDHE